MCSLMYKKYSRDSFDRFGDDLCEEILRYLPLSDCFGLQSVCKQFNALIFNKQTRLVLYDSKPYWAQYIYKYQNAMIKEIVINYGLEEHNSTINNELLKYVMNKCANINCIKILTACLTDETINILSNSCKHLRYFFTINNPKVSRNCWQQFVEKSLQNIESLELDSQIYTDINIKLILLSPKLKSLYCLHNSNLYFDRCFEENTVFGTNIVKVDRYLVDDQRFIKFADHFKYQLKSLSVWFYFGSVFEVVHHLNDSDFDLMKQLTKFKNLEYLSCGFSFQISDDYNCVKLLKLIGQRCLRLKVLAIDNVHSPLNEAFSNRFQSLQKLRLRNCLISESFSYLKDCVNLTHLTFEDSVCYDFDDSYFKDIHLSLPQIKSINICLEGYNDRQYFINIMNDLVNMPNICDLRIGCTRVSDNENSKYYGISTDNVISFIDNCRTIRRIAIYPKHANIDKTVIENYIQSINRKTIFDTCFP